jgi:hypothetical protein
VRLPSGVVTSVPSASRSRTDRETVRPVLSFAYEAEIVGFPDRFSAVVTVPSMLVRLESAPIASWNPTSSKR